jgi:hypothetical protein
MLSGLMPEILSSAIKTWNSLDLYDLADFGFYTVKMKL